MSTSRHPAYPTLQDLRWNGEEFDLAPPPGYQFPSSFQVGMWSTQALVNTSNVIGHLTLLRAFSTLRSTVDGLEQNRMRVWLDQMPEDKDRRWTWFVGRAVERFDRWCKALKPLDAEKRLEDILPPLDVIMVRSAASLEPSHSEQVTGLALVHAQSGVRSLKAHFNKVLTKSRWYAEDCRRNSNLEILKTIGKKLFDPLVSRYYLL
jgi:hypothetical protein